MKKVINVDGSTYKELGQFKEFDLVAVVNQDGDLKLGYLETQAGDRVTIYSYKGGVVEYTIDCINLVNQAQTEWYKKFLEKQELKFNADKRRFESTKKPKLKFGRTNLKFGVETFIGGDRCVSNCDTVVYLGQRSDGLCCLDIDCKGILFPKLATCIEETPNGYHIYFRHNGGKTNVTISPTCTLYRGDNRYMICSPTNGYSFIKGSFDNIPTYSDQDLEELINIFKKQNYGI